MKFHIAPFALFVMLSGCASYKPIPENYTGPIATVTDSGETEDRNKKLIFSLIEIDGHSIENSFFESRRASANQGLTLNLRVTERDVPAHSMKVKLKASHATGAPIHEIASRAMGTFFDVEGVVDFSPVPGGHYLVTGILAKNGSSVWIEDSITHQVVTEKIIEK